MACVSCQGEATALLGVQHSACRSDGHLHAQGQQFLGQGLTSLPLLQAPRR